MADPSAVVSAEPDQSPRWEKLPSIPDPEGFAGAFAGVSGGALIVAGGANITGDKWAEPLQKKWYDSVFVLDKSDGVWRTGLKLSRPLGYGVSVTTGGGVVCIGGSDSERHYADVFRIEWRGERLVTIPMPALPRPCANFSGSLVGDAIYVAGGIATPDSTEAMKTFWKLDLAARNPRWEELEPWPGPERMLAVAGVHEGSFYLFSGVKLKRGADGKPVREYLRDAYRFAPEKKWTRIADLPRAAAAAPTPALLTDGARLLVVTGDDGANVDFKPVSNHPGFPRDALAYDPQRNTWSVEGQLPFSLAVVPVVNWHGLFVIPNGEVRPRVRTPEVWATETLEPPGTAGREGR